MVDIALSPTQVAPLSEREEYRDRMQTPPFPHSFLHDLHRQIDALAAQIDAFREEREVLLHVVRADLRPGYQDAQRTVGSSRGETLSAYGSLSPVPIPELGPDMGDVLSPFYGYGMPLRRGFVDVAVQTQPPRDPTTVRSRLLIPQRAHI